MCLSRLNLQRSCENVGCNLTRCVAVVVVKENAKYISLVVFLFILSRSLKIQDVVVVVFFLSKLYDTCKL
jgi:hypothetical protein